MNWYAVRLRPMAARPSKHDSRFTNIEYALGSAGIPHYMPMERKETIHHRTKERLDKAFPLLPGYAFVSDVRDWYELHRVDYVAGVLGVQGNPLKLRDADIDEIRTAEAIILAQYEATKARRDAEEAMRANHMTKRTASALYPTGSSIRIDDKHMLLGGHIGQVKEATGRNTIKAIVQTLNGMVTAEVSLSMVSKVA